MGDKDAAGKALKATIVDVAALAGVSVSAVSRAFNPEASCSARMREKVMQAAEQLAYKPNRMARAIRAGSRLIGILVTDFANPAYLPILNDFTRALQQRGYHSLLINVGDELDMQRAVELVMEYQVDGLLVTSSTLPGHLVDACRQQRMPVVIFARYSRNNPVTAVCCDNLAAGRMAADCLSAGGYHNFAYVSGVAGATPTLDRQRGFVSRLLELGHEQWRVVEGGQHSYQAGYQATLTLFGQADPPDALFFTNDIMACGGMDALRYAFDLHVPEDVGVVGMDDIELAGNRAYELTSIRQPFGGMVQASVDALLEQISSGEIPTSPEPLMLDCELVVRGSCRVIC